MKKPEKIKIVCPGCSTVNEVGIDEYSRFYCEGCGRLIKGRIPIQRELKKEEKE